MALNGLCVPMCLSLFMPLKSSSLFLKGLYLRWIKKKWIWNQPVNLNRLAAANSPKVVVCACNQRRRMTDAELRSINIHEQQQFLLKQINVFQYSYKLCHFNMWVKRGYWPCTLLLLRSRPWRLKNIMPTFL